MTVADGKQADMVFRSQMVLAKPGQFKMVRVVHVYANYYVTLATFNLYHYLEQ